ncbi:hypothetical protein C8T65DRAFT_746838 [Cerioporus squamosus]|nr:hypothetical protein C8T65DRAFT_746838 [Cerioporus squamosus]
MPDLRTYLLCFPNLWHLQCGNSYTTWFRHQPDADIYQVSCCDATIQQWHDYNKWDNKIQAHGWTTLRSFRGSIIDAYVLSLPCRGLHLHLMSTGGSRAAEYAMLSTILSDIRPSSLRFALKVYKSREYIPILPPQSLSGWATDLARLEIRINIVQQFFDLNECFSHVLELLQSLPLSSSQLELRCSNKESQLGEEQEDPMEGESRMTCHHPMTVAGHAAREPNT